MTDHEPLTFELELALEGEDSEEVRTQLQQLKQGTDSIALPQELLAEVPVPEKEGSISDKIRAMSVPQKIKLAMLGNQTARTVLIRDPLKKVALFVLGNPRLTEAEVIELAGNPNLDQVIFREIARNSHWMKNYAIKRAIVFNARVPIDVSSRWLKFIQDKDLQKLSKSKNIPQVVSSQSRKLIEQRKKKGSNE